MPPQFPTAISLRAVGQGSYRSTRVYMDVRECFDSVGNPAHGFDTF